MLTQILALLDEGRAFSQLELAQRMSVSVESIQAQMEYLERTGMLRRIHSASSCSSCSGSCGGSCGCAQDTAIAMWEKVSA